MSHQLEAAEAACAILVLLARIRVPAHCGERTLAQHRRNRPSPPAADPVEALVQRFAALLRQLHALPDAGVAIQPDDAVLLLRLRHDPCAAEAATGIYTFIVVISNIIFFFGQSDSEHIGGQQRRMQEPPSPGLDPVLLSWLEDLGLAHLAPEMARQNIDSAIVALLTHEQLDELGVTRLGDRAKLIRRSQDTAQETGQAVTAGASRELTPMEFSDIHLALGRRAQGFLQMPSNERPDCPICIEVRTLLTGARVRAPC